MALAAEDVMRDPLCAAAVLVRRWFPAQPQARLPGHGQAAATAAAWNASGMCMHVDAISTMHTGGVCSLQAS
eukprot:SAG11_NODE_1674_length_4478_cov_2.341631_6_plen_72_part_00